MDKGTTADKNEEKEGESNSKKKEIQKGESDLDLAKEEANESSKSETQGAAGARTSETLGEEIEGARKEKRKRRKSQSGGKTKTGASSNRGRSGTKTPSRQKAQLKRKDSSSQSRSQSTDVKKCKRTKFKVATKTDASRKELLKGAISHQQKCLSESVDVKDFLTILWAEGVIDEAKKEKIQAFSANIGDVHAASLFWSMLLRDEIPVVRFVETMQRQTEHKHWICDKLDEYVAKVKSGEWPLYGEPDFNKIEEMLRKKYLNEAWMKLEVIPDEEKAVIQISKELLTPDFRSQVVKPSALCSSSLFETEVLSEHYEIIVDNDLHDILSHVSHLERKSVLTDLQPNLVELLGVAGTGKTTAVKKLTYTWATARNQLVKNYDLIFFIPIRDIIKDELMDILCDTDLLPKSEKKSFYHFLQSSEQARKVLFVLDGVDENDLHEGTDLFNLVTGRLFPNVTVLITARPEGKSLGIIDKKPRLKVTLHGVDKASVDRMLADAVKGSSEEDKEKFKQRYKEKLSDTSLLIIPLYLTLLCFVFKEDIAKGIKCVNLKIPETMTRLFNAIMHVILRRWLQKRKHNNVAISFRDSPLEMDSTVPSEIRRILYFIGRVCYNGILGNKYQFSDQDAKKNHLDMVDIKQSGLFTVGRGDSGEIFFTKHKQLQEYLAALYLVYEGTKEPCFHEILHKEENKGRGLIEVMTDCNMVKLAQFACGLSRDFLKSMLGLATSNLALLYAETSGYFELADILYAAVLFTERNVCDLSAVDKQTLEGCDALEKYLCNAKLRSTKFSLFWVGNSFRENCLKNMIRALDKHVCAVLLNRFYDLKLSPSDCGPSTELGVQDDVCHCVCDHFFSVKLDLDLIQACLLSKVQIHNVTYITSSSVRPMYFDVVGLLNTFPDVTMLNIHPFDHIYQSTAGKLQCDTSTKLKHLVIQCFKSGYDMPIYQIQTLLKQSSLTSLKLLGVQNILTHLSEHSNQKNCLWNGLQELVLHGCIYTSPQLLALCALLKANFATLQLCHLQIFVPFNCQTHLSESLKSLSQLKELVLLESKQQDLLADVLAECLPALTNLVTLEVESLYLTSDVLAQLAEGIKTLVNLKRFTLTCCNYEEDFLAELAIQSLPYLPQIISLRLKAPHIKPYRHEKLPEVLKSLPHLESLNSTSISPPGQEIPEDVPAADIINHILSKTYFVGIIEGRTY